MDAYGGSVENRCRFPLEVLDAIIDVWGSRAVGIKICPPDDYNDSTVSYEELTKTYTYYIKELMRRDLAFINLSRRGCDVGRETDEYFRSQPRPAGKELPPGYEPMAQFGSLIKYPGSRTMLMVNHEYTVEEAEKLIEKEKIDLVTFARPFIYNPVRIQSRFLRIAVSDTYYRTSSAGSNEVSLSPPTVEAGGSTMGRFRIRMRITMTGPLWVRLLLESSILIDEYRLVYVNRSRKGRQK